LLECRVTFFAVRISQLSHQRRDLLRVDLNLIEHHQAELNALAVGNAKDQYVAVI